MINTDIVVSKVEKVIVRLTDPTQTDFIKCLIVDMMKFAVSC